MSVNPGLIILLGSGETAPSMRKVYDWLFMQLESPPHISIMETPAGFEPNSYRVAEKISEFFGKRLQNYHPEVSIVPARKLGTAFSPDDPEIVSPMATSDVIFMGPGSPTYVVRQLQDTLAWHTLVAQQMLGASIILASATTLAFSSHTLPVYEIYKVGEELHWHLGLDFFGLFGLSLVLVPHWNNTEGGADLDTSRCYMGLDRFEQLMQMLPPRQKVVGIDEHTALILNPLTAECYVLGIGGVTLVAGDEYTVYKSGETFPISVLGSFQLPDPQTIVPPDVWETVRQAQEVVEDVPQPSPDVLAMLEARIQARNQRDWTQADRLREAITQAGWRIKDTPSGSELEFIG
jgi:hypothetical protein